MLSQKLLYVIFFFAIKSFLFAGVNELVSDKSNDGPLSESITMERAWGTYYGGSLRDWGETIVVDEEGNVIIAGKSESAGLATSGAFQESKGSGYDCIITKFSANGLLLWSTYIGGNDNDNITDIVCDNDGNIYFTGGTRSSNPGIIATSGAYKETITGDLDAFIIKLNKNGERVWGTYFGGKDLDKGQGIGLDSEGNIIICGQTESNKNENDNIATIGAHQYNYNGDTDGFLAKFDANGNRLWSTYFGGTQFDYCFELATGPDGSISIVGRTKSTKPDGCIASSGAHQGSYGGAQDGFIAKFDKDGNRLWSTYYGGSGNDQGTSIVVDQSGNVYAGGMTQSSAPNLSIATSDAHQPKRYGNWDGFLVKFDQDGQRIWATYYGGTQDDFSNDLKINEDGMICMNGNTKSSSPSNSIATEGAYKTNFGGILDAYFAIFSTDGQRLYASYYGGEGNDSSPGLAVGPDNSLYLTGLTNTKNQTSQIASDGAVQSSFGGHNNDMFAAKFTMNIGEILYPSEKVVLVSPEDDKKLVDLNVDLEWEHVDLSEFYHIVIYGNGDGPIYDDSTYAENGGDIHNLQLDIFDYDITYRWKVRAGNQHGWGPWSDIYSFVIPSPAPTTTVVLIAPENNHEDSLNSIDFSWEHNTEALKYHIHIRDSEGEIIHNDSLIADKEEHIHSLNFNSFKYGKTYNWKMRAGNQSGYGPWSETRTFVILQKKPYEEVFRIFPQDMHNDTTLTLHMIWRKDNLADFYHLLITESDGTEFFDDSLIVGSEENFTTFQVNNFEYNKTYKWKIRSGNSMGYGPWTDEWEFSIENPVSVKNDIPPTKIARIFPNPADKSVSLMFHSNVSGKCNIDLFNTSGLITVQLFEGIIGQGENNIQLNLRSIESGIYFARIVVGGHIQIVKIILSR